MRDEFDMRFDSRINNIRIVRAALRTFLKLKNVHESDIFDTELAINEALANVIEHTYKFRESEKIDFNMVWKPEEHKCEFLIRDYGKKIEMAKVVSRDLEDVKDHGLGVYLMKNIMDAVYFMEMEAEGNLLCLEKKFELEK